MSILNTITKLTLFSLEGASIDSYSTSSLRAPRLITILYLASYIMADTNCNDELTEEHAVNKATNSTVDGNQTKKRMHNEVKVEMRNTPSPDNIARKSPRQSEEIKVSRFNADYLVKLHGPKKEFGQKLNNF